MDTENIHNIMISVLSGEATEKEKLELEDWINQSPEHVAQFKRLSAFYVHPAPIAPVNVDEAWMKVKQATIGKKKKKTLSINYRLIAYAAILTIVISAGLYFITYDKESTSSLLEGKGPVLVLANGEKVTLNDQSFSMQKEGATINNNSQNNILSYQNEKGTEVADNKKNHLYIPVGTTYKIKLADGTQVTLNALSELIYPTGFGKGNREVTLKGEAFFEVAKDAKRPFIVHTGPLSVQVLGTTFNVCSYASESVTQTTLIEGSVKVSQGDESQVITPSQQYTYNKTTGKHYVRVVNTSEYTAWLNHECIFKESSLEEIFNRLQLWYPLSVNYENEKIKQLHFSLRIDKQTSLDQIIELINFTNEVKIEKVNQNSINIKTN